MSVIVIAETPGLDAEGYERIVKEQGHRTDELPAGCTAHFAGPADGAGGSSPSGTARSRSPNSAARCSRPPCSGRASRPAGRRSSRCTTP